MCPVGGQCLAERAPDFHSYVTVGDFTQEPFALSVLSCSRVWQALQRQVRFSGAFEPPWDLGVL